jgi:long-subunit acyl-CoA synthetase (AMP-forming)
MYDPAKTAETIDVDGFLKSGDIGEFDENSQAGFEGKYLLLG